jgi:hypothetical protein
VIADAKHCSRRTHRWRARATWAWETMCDAHARTVCALLHLMLIVSPRDRCTDDACSRRAGGRVDEHHGDVARVRRRRFDAMRMMMHPFDDDDRRIVEQMCTSSHASPSMTQPREHQSDVSL